MALKGNGRRVLTYQCAAVGSIQKEAVLSVDAGLPWEASPVLWIFADLTQSMFLGGDAALQPQH